MSVKKIRKAGIIRPGHEPRLAPGVRGYTVWSRGALYVPLVIADTPGGGDVGRYLDSLPKDRVVKFPTVISARLAGMLQRRGFRLRMEHAHNEQVEVWTREAINTDAAKHGA